MSFAVDFSWPPSPIVGSSTLVPITSWGEMHQETRETGVEFEAFWLENVEEGVAYFFRWMGAPRATILAIWNEDDLIHVECRGHGDRLLTAQESLPAVEEIHRLFSLAGYSISVKGGA